jgi:ribosomal peptide maturation radical SAM protein 1
LLFETSRGCWWGERAHCTFCGLNGTTMAYRAMESERAVGQFERLFSYWPRCSRFESVDNIMPKQYLTEVFPSLDPPPRSTIFYEVKADLKADQLEILSRAAVKEIQPGIESLATSTLKLMRKGTTAFQNIIFLRNCLTYGISPVWNLLIGFPGETDEVYRKYIIDLPLLFHLPPPSGVYPVRFDRFSPYFTQAQQYGLDLQPSDFYGFIYPFSQESLANLAYYFADQNYSAPYMTTMIAWNDRLKTTVERWRSRWKRDDKQPHPQLVFRQRGSSTIVYDTREGSELEHELGNRGAEILRFLIERRQLVELAREFRQLSETVIVQEVSWLKEHGLIFEEDGRYLSLVLTDGSGC